jgi:hypothetical protein
MEKKGKSSKRKKKCKEGQKMKMRKKNIDLNIY